MKKCQSKKSFLSVKSLVAICLVASTPSFAEDIVSRPVPRETLRDIPLLNPFVGEYKGTVSVGYYGDAQGEPRSCYVNIGAYKTNITDTVVYDGYFVQIMETDMHRTNNVDDIWTESIWPIDGLGVMVYYESCKKKGANRGECLTGSLRVANGNTEYPENVYLEVVDGELISAKYKQTIGGFMWPLPIFSDDSREQVCVGLEKISEEPQRYQR